MALHFGTVSVAALPANALALPAVAPVMWIGMAQAAIGQAGAVGAAAALLGRSSHPRVAALGLAVAWLKPQFGLPLAILLFARGSRRVRSECARLRAPV